MRRRRPRGPFAWGFGALWAVVAALAVLPCLPDARAVGRGGESSAGASAEALVVHGASDSEGRDLREGLEELRTAVSLRPGWQLARRLYAYALLRAGRFREAGDALSELIGPALASALENGDLTGRGAETAAEPEDVLGLAIVRDESGAPRAADRLYRAYADLVGETSPDAARAYRRLADMYKASGVEWGDASAELARATATDPDIETRSTLPRYPDLAAYPELEPYMRAITLSPEREMPSEGYDKVPRLSAWTPPGGAVSSGHMVKTVELEILVGEDGRAVETRLPEGMSEDGAPAAAIRKAATDWVFEPALSEGLPAEAWVTFEVEVPAEPAASDSIEEETNR